MAEGGQLLRLSDDTVFDLSLIHIFASLSVCMTLNIFASLIEVNVDSMVSYLGSQNEMVVYVDPEADDATICLLYTSSGEEIKLYEMPKPPLVRGGGIAKQ